MGNILFNSEEKLVYFLEPNLLHFMKGVDDMPTGPWF